MKVVNLEIEPNDLIIYKDIQFGDLSGAKLDHIRVHSFGIYAVIELNGRQYTVPYHKPIKFNVE